MMEVFDSPCYGCPFSSTSIVSPERVRDIREECETRDVHFICHKGQTQRDHFKGREIVCGGYYRSIFEKTGRGAAVRIMERFGGLKLIPVPPEADAEARRTMKPWRVLEGPWKGGKKPARRKRP